MQIRRVTLEDLSDLAQLFDAYRVWYRKPSNTPGATDFLRNRIQNEESIIFIAASPEGELTGFTQLYPLFSSTRLQRLWLLNDLYIKPEFRGKGISKMLIETAKDLARETNACGVQLETELNNDIGNQLYPKMGFTRADEEVNFYFWETKN